MNCLYCPFRSRRRERRTSWKKEELVAISFDLYKKRKIRGVFLSSSLFADPDIVVERQLEVLEALREKGFSGYMHLRLMPGVSKSLLYEAIEVADRIGINLEAPNKAMFEEIAPDKADWRNDIYRKLEDIVFIAKRRKYVSVDTQLIYWSKLGVDLEYLELTEKLYKLGLKRVYFSAFVPIPKTPLENEKPEKRNRVIGIYRASFLIRDYDYTLEDLKYALDESGNLLPGDPKEIIFRKRIQGRIDVREASYEELIRVPGIGQKTARILLELREKGQLNISTLRKYVNNRSRLIKILRYIKLP